MEEKLMAKRLNIGIDVDGVISNFTGAARKLLKQLFNGKPSDDLVQTSWAFESLGITAEEEREMWDAIDAIPNWWLDHEVLPGTSFLPQLCEKHRVIFITNRKDGTGWPIEDQTKVWLKRNFGLFNPTVIISDDKAPIAKGLKLHAFIDDRPKNITEVVFGSLGTKTYILDTTYNQDLYAPVVVPRIKSLNEFALIIEGELKCS